MTVRQALFIRLVSAAMARAHRAAERFEHDHPGWTAEAMLAADAQFDQEHPSSLPDVRFFIDDCNDGHNVPVSLHATTGRMYRLMADVAKAEVLEPAGA